MNASVPTKRSDRRTGTDLTDRFDPAVDGRRTTGGAVLAAAVPVVLVVAVLLPALALAGAVSLAVAAAFSLVVGR